MNVITVKDADFLRPNSPDNKKAISKQIKIIRELYKVFPYAVVAGGCPVNHLIGVPGRDIDIFVTSETEAEQIVQHFTTGLTSEQSRIEQFTMKNPDGAYVDNFNNQCWKFFGASQQPRNPGLFDMNVIVRKIPVETQILHRIQLLPLLWETFPISRFAHAYLDHDGLYIMTAGGGVAIGTEQYKEKSFHKSLMFALATNQARGKSATKTVRTAEVFRHDIRSVSVMAQRPSESVLACLFKYTSYLLSELFRTCYKVSSRNNILESQHNFRPVQGWGRCMTDTELTQILTGERTIDDVHQEVANKGRAVREESSSKGPAYLSDLSWYGQYQRSSLGPRSQDWLDTWGTAQTVQSSGGQGAVVAESATISFDSPFRNTNVLQRNISPSDLERIRASLDSRAGTFTITADFTPPPPRTVSVASPNPFTTNQFGGPVHPRTEEPF